MFHVKCSKCRKLNRSGITKVIKSTVSSTVNIPDNYNRIKKAKKSSNLLTFSLFYFTIYFSRIYAMRDELRDYKPLKSKEKCLYLQEACARSGETPKQNTYRFIFKFTLYKFDENTPHYLQARQNCLHQKWDH